MTNFVDGSGLNLESLTDIIDQLETGFRNIYGEDINLGPNSPDAQMINLFAQAKIDLLECIGQVYASFDPDQATGAVLDQRCSINGVKRRGATFTRTNVTITTNRILTLPGKDTSTSPFTVSDGSGTLFVLEETTELVNGANVLIFSAKEAGNVETLPNTLTTIETVTLGVLSSNNPTSVLTQGIDEETDPQLRVRRSKVVALPSVGATDSTTAALFVVDDVFDAKVYENITNATDSKGVPAHSIWAIVDGGTDAEVAQAIYSKRNQGCGMRGDEQVVITQSNGIPFTVKFDRPIYQDLYIDMTIVSVNENHTPEAELIKQRIFEAIQYKIYEPADFTTITKVVKEFDEFAVVTDGGVSDAELGPFDGYIYPTTVQHRFIISVDRINVTVV